MNEFEYTIVNKTDVPARQNKWGKRIWLDRFALLTDDKAMMLRHNNRQRAHQVANSIRGAASYHKIPISTRIIHAEPAIHNTDGYLVYFWKRNETTQERL